MNSRLLYKIFIGIVIILSWASAVFYPKDYQGYHKITSAVVHQELKKELFNNPRGVGYMLGIGGKKIAFCVDEGWHRVVFTREDVDWIKSWGDWSTGIDGFRFPVGVTKDWYRNIYIADAGNGRIVKLCYNTDNDEFEFVTTFTIGAQGSVWDIDFENGELFVTDPTNHRVYKLSETGTILISYGQYGSGVGQFNRPRGIAAFGDNVYVADAGNNRILWLEDKGDHFEWKGVRYLTEFHWTDFWDVEVDGDGYVYVVDRLNCHILKFAPYLAELLLVFGEKGANLNQFCYPGFMHIYGNDVIISEDWSDSSGIQYYGIKTGISEAKVMIDNFDATERGTNFYFKLDGQASIDVGIRDSLGHKVITLIKDSLMSYGAHYVEWNGRDTTGKVVLPGKYICDIYATSGSDVDDVHLVFRVKGTIKSGVLDVNEHWTEAGEPYVLVGDVQQNVGQDFSLAK